MGEKWNEKRILLGKLLEIRQRKKGIMLENNSMKMNFGHAVAQAVSRWLPTAAAWVRVREEHVWGVLWTK
jgi:hypothetical protein